VTDGVIRRMIDKWLKAAVLEHGLLRLAAAGTPQGGVISPLLANPAPRGLELERAFEAYCVSPGRVALGVSCIAPLEL
jgi:hypothetical protein